VIEGLVLLRGVLLGSLEQQAQLALVFATASVAATDLPIWSITYINPRMAEMKNRAPLLEHNGHPVEERVLLPAAYISRSPSPRPCAVAGSSSS
jgi:hypothetical protein